MIRYGFMIGDRWPICKRCGRVFKTPYRKDERGHWRSEAGDPFDQFEECSDCVKTHPVKGVGCLRLAVIHYADSLGEVPAYTIRWAGNRYVMVKTTAKSIGPDTARMHVFFSEVGGMSKGEALYWADRAASKNGLPLVIPPSFENVEAKAP